MAITKVSRGLLNTGISDSSDSTAITITSGEKVQVKTGFTMNSAVALNNTGDFKIIESANSTAGVGYAAPIIGVNIDDAVNGSNTPTQDNVWGGVSGASALSFGADMSADNATHMFWGSGPSESAGTALTKLLSVSRNGGISFGADTCNNANTLDDYEKGVWIPTVVTGTIGVTAGSAEYTKIGDMVFAQARIHTFSNTTSNNAIILGGLPYSVGLPQSHIGTAWGNFGESIDRPTIFFYQTGSAYYAGNNYGHATHASIDSGTNLIISLIYRHG